MLSQLPHGGQYVLRSLAQTLLLAHSTLKAQSLYDALSTKASQACVPSPLRPQPQLKLHLISES